MTESGRAGQRAIDTIAAQQRELDTLRTEIRELNSENDKLATLVATLQTEAVDKEDLKVFKALDAIMSPKAPSEPELTRVSKVVVASKKAK